MIDFSEVSRIKIKLFNCKMIGYTHSPLDLSNASSIEGMKVSFFEVHLVCVTGATN